MVETPAPVQRVAEPPWLCLHCGNHSVKMPVRARCTSCAKLMRPRGHPERLTPEARALVERAAQEPTDHALQEQAAQAVWAASGQRVTQQLVERLKSGEYCGYTLSVPPYRTCLASPIGGDPGRHCHVHEKRSPPSVPTRERAGVADMLNALFDQNLDRCDETLLRAILADEVTDLQYELRILRLRLALLEHEYASGRVKDGPYHNRLDSLTRTVARLTAMDVDVRLKRIELEKHEFDPLEEEHEWDLEAEVLENLE